jgi:glycosyltransferase involved in cell wall biosynthesis
MKPDRQADISVIVQVFNHEKLLEKALTGIEVQEFDGTIEVIIHDDASTDQSPSIYNRYAENSRHTVKIVRQPENKFSRKIPFLPDILAACTGKVIAVCDGDDFWVSPLKLANQYKALEILPNVDICFHKALRVNWLSEAGFGYLADYGNEPKLFSPAQVIEGDGGFMPSASLMIRRSVFDAMPQWIFEPPAPPAGDYFWQVYGAQRGGALYLPMCAAAYREGHPESWTQQIIANQKHFIDFDLAFLSYIFQMRESIDPQYKGSVDNFIMRRFLDACSRCHQGRQIEDIWRLISLMSNNYPETLASKT